jgi:hypothetical protein
VSLLPPEKLRQIKELFALTTLALLSSISRFMFLKDITNNFIFSQNDLIIKGYFNFSRITQQPFNILLVFLLPVAWYLILVTKRKIPRICFDAIGGLLVMRLLFGFVLVNALLFSRGISANLLFGQIILFIPVFVITWGWLFWRIDCQGRELPQQIIRIPGSKGLISAFDYYYASAISLVNKGNSEFQGITRTGRLLTMIYSLMLMNILGIFLARAYNLVQNML